MDISLRSYLTAGISLTAASAIALTPLVVPANERAITIPSVTVADIQLTVTPQEIVAFFNNLQGELEAFNEDLAAAAALPGQTLVDGLQLAIETNDDFYATLAGLTTNPILLALLDALGTSSTYGLESLQIAIDEGNTNFALTTEALLNLLDSTVTGSLSNVLSSFVNVINNPLSTAAYAGLLSTGVVATGQLFAANGLSTIQRLGDSGFGFAYTGIELVEDQIFNSIETVRDLMNIAAGATGIDLIEAVNAAIQSITLGPIQAISNVGFGVTTDVIAAVEAGFDDIIGGAQAIVGNVGVSLQAAINTVGSNPLNPSNYLVASAILLASGFSTFNTTVGTVGDVAQIPFNLGIEVTEGITGVVTDLNLDFALALAGVLSAAGLPAEIAGLPVALATQANNLISAGAAAVVGGLGIASGLVEGGTEAIIDASNTIEAAIFGLLPNASAGANTLAAPADTPALKVASETSGRPSGDVVAVADEDEDDVVADDKAPADEAPADDDAPADDAPTDDDAPADDEAADDDSEKSAAETKREERKAEREAKKAERESKKADSDDSSASDKGSDDKGSDKDSDTGSDSDSDSGAAA